MNKMSTGTWLTSSATANAVGQQGAKRPESQTASTEPPHTDPDLPAYLYKTSDLTWSEVTKLLKRFSCPLCRRNNHALHMCNALKSVYSIKLKSQPDSSTNTTTNESTDPQVPTVNFVSNTLPYTIEDTASRYEGYENVTHPPPASDSDTSTDDTQDITQSITTSSEQSKLKDSSMPYMNSTTNSLLTLHVGSIRQATITMPLSSSIHTEYKNVNEYPVIIDSGATHHMWNDSTAFISYAPTNNSYVSLANDYKIPMKGIGSIQLNINGYILQIHNVFYVPALQYCLYSVKQHRRYNQCSCIFNNDAATLSFPKFTVNINDEHDMFIYATSLRNRASKIHWSSTDGMKHNGRMISDNNPHKLPYQKPNPSNQAHRRISNIDIHKYMGFRTLKTLKSFQEVSQNTVTFINAGEIPHNIGNFTTIKKHTHNKAMVERPKHFFDIAHIDIAYGDTVAPGAIKFALIIVDRKTRYNYCLPLQDCKSSTITVALQKLKVLAGKLPKLIYTDFDPKLLSKTVTTWLQNQNTIILAAPPEQQHQNGLVERTWQTLSQMARAYVNDKLMPRSFWFWAIRHASRIQNIFPIRLDDKLTTPHEPVYKTKPDYRQLFRLFSTAFFTHVKDGVKARTNIQSHTMAGIAVGYSDVANGMEVYNPLTKELYTTSRFKLDEHHSTKTYFNLDYDGGIFSGLYSLDCNQNVPEPYPLGTAVQIPSPTGPTPGYVLAVPSNNSTEETFYTIQLLSGQTTTVPSSAMSKLVDPHKTTVNVTLPPWIHSDAKVQLTLGRITHQGRLQQHQDQSWSFIVKNRLGETIKTHNLPDFTFNYHSLINSKVLKPGWTSTPTISANRVSATTLVNPCPPTLSKALSPDNADAPIWLESYKEEYNDLKNMEVYEEITPEQYKNIQHKSGKPLPSMCVLTIKYKDGYPDRVKSRIVVLGNQQSTTFIPSDTYAPVISQNQFRCLLSIAVQNKRKLKQGDVKNAFCNGILPTNEIVVITPPKGCPLSQPNSLWRLRKTLYGLKRSPLHWFQNISSYFKSIGLQNSPNSPCVFQGTILPNHPPLYVGLYVDDFAYFSTSDEVEAQFKILMDKKYTVSYEDCLEWFLGMKFTWYETESTLKCHIHQEAFILDMVDRHQLTQCNKSPRATPFRSGFTVDSIAPSSLDDRDQLPLTKKFQQAIRDLN